MAACRSGGKAGLAPGRAEAGLPGQRLGHGIALQPVALAILQVERGAGVEVQQLVHPAERQFALAEQRLEQFTALPGGQRLIRSAESHGPEVGQLAEDAELLRDRQRPGCTRLVRDQGATAGIDGLERALAEYDRAQPVPCFGVQRRVMRRLRRPQGIELRFDQRPVRIERVARLGAAALQARPHRLAEGMAPGQESAEGGGSGLRHQPFQRGDGRLDLAGLLVVGLVGLAVGLEAAALVQVEQRAAEFVRAQRAVQSRGTERVGLQRLQRGACNPVGRHQPERHQRVDQRGASPQIAVPPLAHAAGDAPFDRQRGLRLRIAPVREDPDAEPSRTDAVRVAFGAEIEQAQPIELVPMSRPRR